MIDAIKYLRTSKPGLRHCNRQTIANSLGMACIALLICICVSPLAIGWNGIDITFNRAIIGIMVIGLTCCIASKTYPKFSIIDYPVIILFGYFMARYYLNDIYPAKGIAIHTTYAFFLYLALRLLFSGIHINGKVVTFLILILAIYEASFGIYQVITGTSRHNLYLMTGSFNNPGPYSACLAMGLVITCAYLEDSALLISTDFSEKMKNSIGITLQALAIVFTSIIILTLSRTAFIASALCLLIIFRKRMGKWIWLTIGMILAVGVGLYFIKAGSAQGRLAINWIGMHAIAENPIFGCGVGSFFNTFAETTEYLTLNGTMVDLSAVDVVEYAFNDWLQIGVELGCIGLSIAAAITLLTLRNLWKKSLPLFLVFFVIIVFSFFSYPLELLPYRIITIIILAFIASQSRLSLKYKCSKAIYVYIPVIVIIMCLQEENRNVKELVKAEKDYNMLRGINDPAFIKDYYTLLPYLEENRHFLFDYAWMLAHAGRFNDSNDMLRRGALISNDPMFLILQGNNYRDMGAFDIAEQAYLKAWHIMPNRIYPLYRLMKLQEQTGNISKALSYAEIIINYNEKIPSPAVRDMKKEAKELIEHDI